MKTAGRADIAMRGVSISHQVRGVECEKSQKVPRDWICV